MTEQARGEEAKIEENQREQSRTEETTTEETKTEEKADEKNDDMTDFLWDGPEDSDEEIKEFNDLKTQWEEESGVKFSKRGIIEHIEKILSLESPLNKEDPKISKAWEQKLKNPNLTYYLKKGGSAVKPNQPFFRAEVTFNKAFKLEKILKCMYSPEHTLKWDKNLTASEFIPVHQGKKSYGFSYLVNGK